MSIEGDADLYVSSASKFVDFNNYDLQSTTYGVDEVIIEKDMKRPIFISIYGHPYYPHSVYKLYQYSIPFDHNHFEQDPAYKNKNHEKVYADYTKVTQYC